MTSSSKQIHNNNNNKVNNESKGNEIFFGDKEKKKGKIINIPKRLKNKKEDRSQSKNKKMTSVWKTVTQTDRITPKFSPNIKYMEKYKKKNLVFKKEDSKFMNSNNLSSKRTVSVPRFLDTEYILEPQNKKQQFKREESTKNKFKVPKKNKDINISNQNNIKNKNKESINSFKGKIMSNSNPNNKNMKKHISDKNNKQENLGIKNSQIYTEDGANLIDDLDEEETIIELPKHNEKNKKESLVKNNKEISNNKNSIKISINIPNQEIKRSQNMTIENDENDDLEELEDSFYSSEESDSNKNEKIGPSNFVCLALLGQGSFGEVYLVKKKDSDDFYAMKVLDKCRIAKQNIFKYVLTERNILSVMHNPFIVRLNYAFQTSEKLFLLLDYCPGGDLSKQLQIQTRFSEEKAKFYICEIILALGELHKNNIIFRDLKPDNIVIDKEGHALLTDFGLSREGIIGKDVAKSFCGSIAYLAPEMLSRTGHGKGVDWYLLGVLFYELLVGVPPYFTTNQEQIFRNIQNAQLYIPPFVSNKAANLIKSLLKRNPNERLGSKRDVEEIKEHEYFADVDWQKVYERKYKPPQIYLKSNHLQFFRQPLQFKENEEDDLFVKDSNYNNNDYNKYNQDILNSVNNYQGWSFVKNNSK
jgi:serine/threonine protein kinase